MHSESPAWPPPESPVAGHPHGCRRGARGPPEQPPSTPASATEPLSSHPSSPRGISAANVDGFEKESGCCVALHPSSLQRTLKYASLLRVRAPCLRSFLRSRPTFKAFATFHESVKVENANHSPGRRRDLNLTL